ncbi:MAG TPA: hypothetical protein VJT84_14090 [Gaiellaceae bacterium]|nr:hypothetical protein [Gaiellaceae bacterium]
MGKDRAPRLLVLLLSAGTAAWLVAQVTATVKRSSDLWPASGVNVVTKRQDAGYRSRIVIRTTTGRLHRVRPADVGAPSLDSYLARLVYRPPHSLPGPANGADDRLDRLIAAWNRRHPADRAVSATFSVEVLPLPAGRHPRVYQVLKWP